MRNNCAGTNIWYNEAMARNTSIVLGDHFDAFVREQVDEARYASASEVVRAALRLLEDETHKMARLRDALEEGERSGIATGYSVARVLRKARNVHRSRAKKKR